MFFQEFFEMFIYIEKTNDPYLRESETENFDALCYWEFYIFKNTKKMKK